LPHGDNPVRAAVASEVTVAVVAGGRRAAVQAPRSALPLNDVSTRGLLGMPWGPAGTDKAAAEQGLPDAPMDRYPHLFAKGRACCDRRGTARGRWRAARAL